MNKVRIMIATSSSTSVNDRAEVDTAFTITVRPGDGDCHVISMRAFDVRGVIDRRFVIDNAARPVEILAFRATGLAGRKHGIDAGGREPGFTYQHGLCILRRNRHVADATGEDAQQDGQGHRHDHECDQHFDECIAATAFSRTHRPRPC